VGIIGSRISPSLMVRHEIIMSFIWNPIRENLISTFPELNLKICLTGDGEDTYYISGEIEDGNDIKMIRSLLQNKEHHVTKLLPFRMFVGKIPFHHLHLYLVPSFPTQRHDQLIILRQSGSFTLHNFENEEDIKQIFVGLSTLCEACVQEKYKCVQLNV
jgi:hypothetical protein